MHQFRLQKVQEQIRLLNRYNSGHARVSYFPREPQVFRVRSVQKSTRGQLASGFHSF
jgi:hypothetical protein